MKNFKYTSYISDPYVNFDVLHSFTIQSKKVMRLLGLELQNISLIVASNHDHMCQLLGKQRPLWGVTSNLDDTLYMYNPKLWKKSTTGHDYNDIGSSIGHQLIHILLGQYEIKLPIWFEEGFATFVSFYKTINKRENDYRRLIKSNGLPDLVSLNEAFDKTSIPALSYLTAERFVKFLYESDKVGFLKLLTYCHDIKEFSKLIVDVYNKDVASLWKEFSE